MEKRVKDKVDDIKEYLKDLEDIRPKTFKKYENDKEKKAACERYVERIMEAVTDLAKLIIKVRELTLPTEDSESFNVLAKDGSIDKGLAERLKKAKGMRNVIAHLYGEVYDEIVINSISDRL